MKSWDPVSKSSTPSTNIHTQPAPKPARRPPKPAPTRVRGCAPSAPPLPPASVLLAPVPIADKDFFQRVHVIFYLVCVSVCVLYLLAVFTCIYILAWSEWVTSCWWILHCNFSVQGSAQSPAASRLLNFTPATWYLTLHMNKTCVVTCVMSTWSPSVFCCFIWVFCLCVCMFYCLVSCYMF